MAELFVTIILFTIQAVLLPQSRLCAANTARSPRWNTTGITKATLPIASTQLVAHSLVRSLLLSKPLTEVEMSSQSRPKLRILSGKILLLTRTLLIKTDRKVVSLKCSAGRTQTSKLSAKHSRKWAGWESKSSLHRSPSCLGSGQ